MVPLVLITPIWLAPASANQRFPSGPVTIPVGLLLPVVTGYSGGIVPLVELLPILLEPYCSVNQRLPSGPEVMPQGLLVLVGTRKSLTVPSGVTFPILCPSNSVNQRLPSGPVVILTGSLELVGIGNSVMLLLVDVRYPPVLLTSAITVGPVCEYQVFTPVARQALMY